MSDTSFNTAQQAVDTVFTFYDDLIEQGFDRSSALDHASLTYGVERRKLVALLNDRDAGLLGNTGVTTYGTTASRSTASSPAGAPEFAERHGQRPSGILSAYRAPAAAHKPVHGGYPGAVDPDTVVVPSTFPEEWV